MLLANEGIKDGHLNIDILVSSKVALLCNFNLKDTEFKTYITSQTCTKSDKN